MVEPRRIGLALAVLVAACTSDRNSTITSATSSAITSSAAPVTVLDGDTIDVVVGTAIERVRLIGINAPENGECFAKEATAALAALVEGRTLRLEADVSDRDRYGRLLRYVWVEESTGVEASPRSIRPVSVNEHLVHGGFAIARRYEPDVALADVLEAAQEEARAGERGLWAPDACSPPDGATPESGAGAVALSIVAVEFDAPGDDNKNLNGEWVRIANHGQAPVDLTDWILKDESSSHRYSFPVGFGLAPSAEVTVYSGCGIDELDGPRPSLRWCSTISAIWNNDGDTAFLLDPSGNIVASLGY